MRTALVVSLFQQFERRLQLGFIAKIEHPKQLFERRPHTFDAAVHPGALWFDALVADTDPTQGEGERQRSEDGFVVGSDLLRFAVMLDGIEQ